MRNQLRHFHAVQGLVCPFAKLSSILTEHLFDAKFCRCYHSLQPMTFAGRSAGRTELMKHSLVKRLSARTWPCREWATCCCVVYPLPWPLLVGGVRCSRLWFTSQLLRPSGQQCSHSGGVCPQIQGRQYGAYVGAVEEMMCVVCVNVTEGA